MARFAYTKCDQTSLREDTLRKALLGLLLLSSLGVLVSPALANGLKIDEDGNQNVNVTIEESLVPKASIKRTENQMIIQVPEHSGFDVSKLQMNPALKGKVDVVQTGGEKGVPKKTVVTIHSGNIYLNVDNQQHSPPVPSAHDNPAGSDVGVSIPRNTKMAKPPGVPIGNRTKGTSAYSSSAAPRPPHLPRVSELKAVEPKKVSKGMGLPNPFVNPLSLLQPKPPVNQKPANQKPEAIAKQAKESKPLPQEVIRQKQALFKPLSSTAVVSKPVVTPTQDSVSALPSSSTSSQDSDSVTDKVTEKLQNEPKESFQEESPVAAAASLEPSIEPVSEPPQDPALEPETEGEAGIPLNQILPSQAKEGEVPSDVLWRIIASTFLVLVMVVVSIKMGLPKLVSRYPEWFKRFQENAKNNAQKRQAQPKGARHPENMNLDTPSYRSKGQLKKGRLTATKKSTVAPSYAEYATPKPKSTQTPSHMLESPEAFQARQARQDLTKNNLREAQQGQSSSHSSGFQTSDLQTSGPALPPMMASKPDWKSRIFNRTAPASGPSQKLENPPPMDSASQAGSNAMRENPVAKPQTPKALPAVQTSRPEHLKTFAQEGMTLVNHLPLSGNRDLYWVTMEQDHQNRNLVIAASGDQMTLVTHFRDGEAPEMALPQSVYDLLGTSGDPNAESESQQITLPFAQLEHQKPTFSNTEHGTHAYVESSPRPEELAPDPALAERYARRKSFKRLSQWMSGNEASLEAEEDALSNLEPATEKRSALTPKEALKQYASSPSHSPANIKSSTKKQNPAAPPTTDIIEAEEVMVLEDYDDVYHPY